MTTRTPPPPGSGLAAETEADRLDAIYPSRPEPPPLPAVTLYAGRPRPQALSADAARFWQAQEEREKIADAIADVQVQVGAARDEAAGAEVTAEQAQDAAGATRAGESAGL